MKKLFLVGFVVCMQVQVAQSMLSPELYTILEIRQAQKSELLACIQECHKVIPNFKNQVEKAKKQLALQERVQLEQYFAQVDQENKQMNNKYYQLADCAEREKSRSGFVDDIEDVYDSDTTFYKI